jgi:phage gp45-like
VKRRKFLLGSSALFASGGLLTGTGAFSSTEAEREIRTRVEDDSDAYLRLVTDEDGNPEVGLLDADGPFKAPKKITIENQLSSDHELNITVKSNHEKVRLDKKGDESDDKKGDESDDKKGDSITFGISEGEAQDIEINLKENIEIEAKLDINAEDNESVVIDATRTIELEPHIEVQEVTFRGNGGIDIEAIATAPYSIQYYIATDTKNSTGKGPGTQAAKKDKNKNTGSRATGRVRDFKTRTVHDIPSNEKKKIRGRPGGGPVYIAVYFPLIDKTYYHPKFNPDNNTIESRGQGSKGSKSAEGNILGNR